MGFIVYDTVNDQILIGVGNGSPWNPDIRDPNSDGTIFPVVDSSRRC
ncbi:MAG: hypothetical protein CM15mP103_09930 [Gammaproteobacteria bacterium]|nr:MAG: hypothetical protein CM15mP103_09930 [Gammaproteobacteria bacterium]